MPKHTLPSNIEQIYTNPERSKYSPKVFSLLFKQSYKKCSSLFCLFSVPGNLGIVSRTNDSLIFSWTCVSAINTVSHYQASIKRLKTSKFIRTQNLSANVPCSTTFEQLTSYTPYRVGVRACSDKFGCSDEAYFDTTTLPSRTSISLNLRVGGVVFAQGGGIKF